MISYIIISWLYAAEMYVIVITCMGTRDLPDSYIYRIAQLRGEEILVNHDQHRWKPFITGQAKLDPDHYLIKYVGGQ